MENMKNKKRLKMTFDDFARVLKEEAEGEEFADDNPDAEKSWSDIIEDVFLWFQIDAKVFVPVEVKTGRKFRGLGYILSFKEKCGEYMGHTYDSCLYKVWDSKNMGLNEFNANWINLLNLDDEQREKISGKWDVGVEVSQDKMLHDFNDYFTSLVKRAKERCGTDYRYMKNYLRACTRLDDARGRAKAVLPDDLLDQIVDYVKSDSFIP